ncbi:MAG: 2-oxoacid:ferredoxin oxidoreductase subunit gamma [Chloroflexi bacterium]|nr:2-oxoacid:ferredoxin oxidoreductase subunit gamma [Chloroflexota bacterium]
MQEELLFAGFGGQGVMFVGQLLAYAAMDQGYEVTWIPSYGPEMRGGTAHCYVVISDKPIGSPVVRNPKVAIAFNKPSYEKYEGLVAEGGLIAYNASLIETQGERKDIDQIAVPATSLADELGNLKLANIVMLGALLTVRPVLTLDAIREALDAHIPSHRRNLLPLNLQALDKGAAVVADRLAT